MRELQTLEVDRWEPSEKKGMVKHVGMISPKEAFYQLETHLKKEGLLPDEYFSLDASLKVSDSELPDFYEAVCSTNWGNSEGIYFDIFFNYYDYENRANRTMHFATGKTLGETGDDFLRMSRIAAECSMMLNGRGKKVKFYEEERGFLTPEGENDLNQRIQSATLLVEQKQSAVSVCKGDPEYLLE